MEMINLLKKLYSDSVRTNRDDDITRVMNGLNFAVQNKCDSVCVYNFEDISYVKEWCGKQGIKFEERESITSGKYLRVFGWA